MIRIVDRVQGGPGRNIRLIGRRMVWTTAPAAGNTWSRQVQGGNTWSLEPRAAHVSPRLEAFCAPTMTAGRS